MNRFLQTNAWVLGFLSMFILASCSSSENTVVIKDAPITSTRTDTSRQQTEPTGSFQHLTIGENQQIQTLDPLFMENVSEMRAVQLVYEGLVRYDENGKIVPAVARDWSVSNDQRTFRFTLRGDLFFHDSNIFNNGRGRRLVAGDVKQVFERMAKATVPENAAQYFMDIKGFEPYFQEQHHVMMKAERRLGDINGIKTPNDSTVIFSLVKPDSQFMQKLATPYAVIYPNEAVTNSGFKAVGTGPFYLSQQRSDSLYIFARFGNYRESNQPKLDRVDMVSSSGETALLNALNRGDIQFIPKLGPQQMQMVSNADGQLKNALSNAYQLLKSRKSLMYSLRYNPDADASKESVSRALNAIQNASFFSNLPAGTVQLNWSSPAGGSASETDSLASSYSGDPVIQSFYTTLAQALKSHGVTFDMDSTRVINRNTALFATQDFSFLGGDESGNSDNTLATFSVEAWALYNKNIKNLTFNNFSWWIDLRNTTVPNN